MILIVGHRRGLDVSTVIHLHCVDVACDACNDFSVAVLDQEGRGEHDKGNISSGQPNYIS